MSELEQRYRDALRWYPKNWRASNEDAVIGTLLDVADDEKRSQPARGELSNLRLIGLGARVAPVARIYPASVRDRAAAICLGLAAAISLSAIARIVIDSVVTATNNPATARNPFSWPSILCAVVYLLWMAAAAATVSGGGRASRWLVVATIPAVIAVRIVADHVAQQVWTSTTTMCILIVLAIIVAAGTPCAVTRGRGVTLIAFGISVLATAAVGLVDSHDLFAQSPLVIFENLVVGGPALIFYSQGDLVVYWSDLLLRPFQAWFGVAIPALILLAGILSRRRRFAWAGGTLVPLVPIVLTLLLSDAAPIAVGTTLLVIGVIIGMAVVALGLLRLFGLRIRITRA